MSPRAGRSILLLACLLVGPLTGSRADDPPDAQRPNLVVVLTDAHAVRAVSAYGSGLGATPQIDRLAREGVLFERAYCANTESGPSRAALLTGRHLPAGKDGTSRTRLDASVPTLPALLAAAGYQAALVGAWDLKPRPTGFDHWVVLRDEDVYYGPDLVGATGQRRAEGYATDVVTDLAIDWLEKGRDAKRPFLLLCQHRAARRPWVPGPAHVGDLDGMTLPEPPTLFDDLGGRTPLLARCRQTIAADLEDATDLKLDGPLPELRRMTKAQRASWDAAYGPRNRAWREAAPEGRARVRRRYQRHVKDVLRCFASVDDGVGRILDALERNGLAENTIVVYTSDRGAFLGAHGLYGSGWMYEEAVRVPLLLRWPGVARPGARVRALVQGIDLAPTLLEAAGIPLPEGTQGLSLVPLLRGDAADLGREALFLAHGAEEAAGVPAYEGLVTERYKLVHLAGTGDAAWELFDLFEDPREERSVHAEAAYADRRRALVELLARLARTYAAR